MELKIKKLSEFATIPRYANPGDAGLDLTAITKEVDYQHNIVTYSTGLAIEIPEGYVGLLFPRSSVYKTGMVLANCVGIIDSGYRGEVKLKFIKSDLKTSYSVGDRVGQLIIMPFPKITVKEVEELSDSSRSFKGFGSSGN